MTFDAQETSQQGGKIVHLYLFQQGSETVRNTSAEMDVSNILSAPWLSETITNTEPSKSQQEGADSLSVRVPAGHQIAQKYIGIPPSIDPTVTIYQYHRTDGGSPQVVIFWKGKVRSANFKRDGMCDLACKSIQADQSKEIPRFTFGGPCPYVLYGNDCQASETGRRHELTVASVSGNVYTLTGLSTAAGGDATAFVVGRLSNFDETEHRQIVLQSGDDVTVRLPFESLIAGSQCIARFGCARDVVTCHTKFANSARYGGWPFVPDRNYFELDIDS